MMQFWLWGLVQEQINQESEISCYLVKDLQKGGSLLQSYSSTKVLYRTLQKYNARYLPTLITFLEDKCDDKKNSHI